MSDRVNMFLRREAGHFHVEAWIDFVRDVAPQQARLDMARHRASCASCHRLAMMVEDLAATARLDDAFAPPSDVVDRAVRLFDGRWDLRAANPPRARQIVDLRMPGAPSPPGPMQNRRFLYYAEGAAITLDLEREQGTDRIRVTGRLSDPMTGEPLAASMFLGDRITGATLRESRLDGEGGFVIDCRAGMLVLLHVHFAPPLAPLDVFFDADF